jgi:hypothetical protein
MAARTTGAVIVLFVIGVVFLWAGFTGRLPALLGAIIAPSEMQTSAGGTSERAASDTTEAGTTSNSSEAAATGSGAFGSGPTPVDLMLMD